MAKQAPRSPIQTGWEVYREIGLEHGLTAEMLAGLEPTYYAGAACILACLRMVLEADEEGLLEAAIMAMDDEVKERIRHERDRISRAAARIRAANPKVGRA